MISGAPELSAPVTFALIAVSSFRSGAPAFSDPVVFTLTAIGTPVPEPTPEARQTLAAARGPRLGPFLSRRLRGGR